jgi:O-antigen ligase
MRRSSALLLPIWLALCASWILPFLVPQHTYPISTFYSEIAAAVCWIAVATGVLGVTWSQTTGLPKVALAPLLLIAVLIAQLVISPPLNPFFSFGAIVSLLAATVICGLGARCRELSGVLTAIAIAVIAGGLITVAIELLQLFRIPNLPSVLFSMSPSGTARRMWGNLNQPNHVGSYLAFGLAACLFLGNRYRESKWLALLGIAMLALLMGMALTFSRMTWIHVVVVGLLAGIPLSAEGSYRSRHAKLLALVAPALLLTLAYQGWNWIISFANHLWLLDLPGSMGERFEAGVGLRPLLWKHAWHIFLARPWLGGGWGDYAWNQYVQTDTLGRVEMSMNAHNIVLDLLAKVGVVGLFAVLAPFIWWALNLPKRLRHPDVAFACTLIAIMVVHSLLEYPLHYVFFLFPFAFVLGYMDNRGMRIPSASMTWLLSGVLVVSGAALIARLWVDYRVVERLYMSRAGAIKELKGYQESGQLLLMPYATLVMAMNMPISKEMAPVMVGLERQAVQFYPGPPAIQRYALALAFQGKSDEAVVQIRRLRDHFWGDFSGQTGVVRQACQRDLVDLKVFCSRLKSEHLLVTAD